MQPLGASLEPTKTRGDVPEAQALSLNDAECNNQSGGGRKGPFLANTTAPTDKTTDIVTSVAAAATTVMDESYARAAAANIKPAGLE